MNPYKMIGEVPKGVFDELEKKYREMQLFPNAYDRELEVDVYDPEVIKGALEENKRLDAQIEVILSRFSAKLIKQFKSDEEIKAAMTFCSLSE